MASMVLLTRPASRRKLRKKREIREETYMYEGNGTLTPGIDILNAVGSYVVRFSYQMRKSH